MVTRAMQIVAHEDDDLLFMNPDVAETIRGGIASVTVFVTAGQISGNGDTDGQRARSRQLGIQAAYTAMAGAPSGTAWTGTVLTVAGRQIEHYTLSGHPGVELVFVNLPDGGMADLYAGTAQSTILVDGGLVTTVYSYTHANVVSVLRGLLSQYQPTVLRIQDPLPDPRHTPYDEHPDHIATANLAGEAAAAYSSQLMVVDYRCYNIAGSPSNLDSGETTSKVDTFDLYTPFDDFAGDEGWTSREYSRWPRGTAWIGHNADGRLQLFVVRGGAVSTYWQSSTGSWAGPQVLGNTGGALAPVISVGSNADGRLQIFGRRLTDHHIVTAYQTQVNGGWSTSWTDFSNPNLAYGNADQVGVPAVGTNGDGRLEIFVKNGGGGVSTRYQTANNNGWSGWVDLFGADLEDGLTAATNPDGCIELFGSRLDGIEHWYQNVPNEGFTINDEFPAPAPASPPRAVLAQAGTIVVAYRLAGTGQVAVSRQVEVAGGWAASPVVLTGHTGLGEPSLVTAPPGTDARVMIFARKDNGTLAMTMEQSPNGIFGPWTDLDGPVLIDSPAAAVDSTGAVVLAAVGIDGVLYVRKQSSSGASKPFDPWQPLP